jgi:hypothetical protein
MDVSVPKVQKEDKARKMEKCHRILTVLSDIMENKC